MYERQVEFSFFYYELSEGIRILCGENQTNQINTEEEKRETVDNEFNGKVK